MLVIYDKRLHVTKGEGGDECDHTKNCSLYIQPKKD